MTVLTLSELLNFAPHGTMTISKAVVARADDAFGKWGINTAPRLQMFMAMAKVESAGFSNLFENMDYTAKRLVEVWPSHFPNLTAAAPYAHEQQKLANFIYGRRLGNNSPNDGWLCRGTGLMQTTGLSNFARLAKAMDVSVDDCRAMLTADATLLECAVACFVTWGGLHYADHADVESCTKAINGGLNGLADREAAYASAKKIWPVLRPAAPQTSVISGGYTSGVQATPTVPISTSAPALPAHIDVVVKAKPQLSAWQQFCAWIKGGALT